MYMSFFDKMKASIGIGAAKVDTKLEKDSYKQGETVKGNVFVLGGNTQQEVNGLYIHLMTQVLREQDDRKYLDDVTLYKIKVSDAFVIEKGEEKVIPFSMQLPYETPITIGDVSVWMKTEMDVTFALDPKDKDYINVVENETVSSFLKAIESIGFYLNKVKNVPFKRSKTGVFQEFEYKPNGGPFQRSLDEVEIGFVADAQSVDLFIEVDRKARGLSGFLESAAGMDESKIRVQYKHFQQESIETAKQELMDILSRYSR